MKKILLPLIFAVHVIFANTYYVSKTGNNSNSGNLSSPWLTIQYAHNNMIAGDSVIVLAGIYTERVQITIDGLSFIAESKSTHSDGGFFIDAADDIEVAGFDITNTAIVSGLDTPGKEKGTGIYLKGENCIIDNNNIHNTSMMGIYMSSSDIDCEVKNNTLSYNGMCGIYVKGEGHIINNNHLSKAVQFPETWLNQPSGQDADGIRIFGTGHLVKGNTIIGALFTDPGIHDPHIDMMQTWGPLTHTVFDGNFLHNPLVNDTSAQGFMIERRDGPVSDLAFMNNVIIAPQTIININNKGSQGDMPRMKFYNNVFYGTSNIAIRLLGAPDSEIKNNLFYDCHAYLSWKDDVGGSNSAYRPENDYNAHYATNGNPNYGEESPPNIWDKNPLCVDVGSLNFRLRTNSPLINAGTNIDIVTTDSDGVERPIGSSTDMGAYEFDPATSINEKPNVPLIYSLEQNYPNPFNPVTNIRYEIPVASTVKLTIFNMLGQKMATIVDGRKQAGYHSIQFQTSSFSSGQYFYVLEAGGYRQVKRMMLLK